MKIKAEITAQHTLSAEEVNIFNSLTPEKLEQHLANATKDITADIQKLFDKHDLVNVIITVEEGE